MKKYIYILLSVILLFTACDTPDPTGPDTRRFIKDEVQYQIIDQSEEGFQSEVFTEIIIRNREELNNSISKHANAYSQSLIDKLNNVELDSNTLVIIAGSTTSEKTTILLDSIYLDNTGQIQLDYRISRVIGINARVTSPTMAILIKNRKEVKIKFKKQFDDEGENPRIDGFETVAVDSYVLSKDKWKLVFNTADELKKWARENKLLDTAFIDGVDFTKDMVISVGNPRFFTGDRSYKITNVQQQGSRIVVSSVFEMIKMETYSFNKSNHFIKIKKTGLPIYFNTTEIVNNVYPESKFYNEYYRWMHLEVSKETGPIIKKVSNLADLFSIIKPSEILNPANADFDFEFFDLLVIKAPTTPYKEFKFDLEYLQRDDWGIRGKAGVIPDMNTYGTKYDNYMFIKILKTNLPISKNFEIIVN